MNYTNSIYNMMKSLNSISLFDRSMRAMHHFDSLQRMSEMMNSTRTIRAALASVRVDDSVQRMMKSMDFTSSIQKTISSLNYTDLIQKMMESVNYAKTLNNISKFHNISSQMQSLGAFLAKPSILEQIIESNNSWKDLDPNHLTIEQEQFTQSIAPLTKAVNETEFISFFMKIPPVIQAVIIFIFLQFFLPQVNNVISQVFNPYIQEIISTSDKTSKEIVKEIKQVPASSFSVDVSNLRFITGTNVRLRQKNSTNSQVIDELEIGQIVEVVRKKKNWIQVKVTYEEEVLLGWVFTRYTAKFKK